MLIFKVDFEKAFDSNSGDLDNIIRVLHVFYLASDLKINIHKSNIFGIGAPNGDVVDMARRTSYASVFGKISCQVFWGGSQDSRNLAWIKWTNALSSFNKGGLNIGSLKAFNLALFQKWRWRIFSSSNSLWVNVIKSLHGYECGFDNQGCKFNGKWASIVGSSNYLHSKNIIPLNTLRFRVGCGTRIRFWKDIWIGDSPLYIRYNREDIGVRNKAYLRDLLLEISLVDPNVEEDSCVWEMANDGTFSVADTRRLIRL
ncbi:hypothetical protein Tco_0405282 [Tanacetum coccineum]